MDLDTPRPAEKRARLGTNDDQGNTGRRHARSPTGSSSSSVEWLGEQRRIAFAMPVGAAAERSAPLDLGATPAKPPRPGVPSGDGHTRTVSGSSHASARSKAPTQASGKFSGKASGKASGESTKSTRAVIATIQANMRAFDEGVEQGRETLQRQWEADGELQQHELMPQLEELNGRMQAAQDELAAAWRVAAKFVA